MLVVYNAVGSSNKAIVIHSISILAENTGCERRRNLPGCEGGC